VLRAAPLGARGGIDELAAKALLKMFGVRVLRKAKDVHVDVIAAERMTARAEREAVTENADRLVIAAGAAIGRQRHLMRPLAIDRSFAEFAFAVDHSTSLESVAARRPLLAGKDGGAFVRLASGVHRHLAMLEQKGNIFITSLWKISARV
jgi:hypothetical protein